MKTRILMLLAAVLLGSASAMAQSSNSEPLKGDVNGDGIVDVADINAVIKIMKDGGGTATKTYWYAEQNASDNYITAENYTSIATQEAFTSKSFPMTIGNYLYVVVPTSKTVEVTDPAGNYVNFKYFNTEKGQYGNGTRSVGDYYIMRSTMAAAVNETWTVIVKSPETYYWYVGTTKPTSLSQATVVDSYPSEYTYTNNSGAKAHIFVLTNSDQSVEFIEPNLDAPITQVEVDVTTIPGYKIFETAVGTANTKPIKIRITQEIAYYYYVGWTLPTSSNVDEIINETYPAAKEDATMNKAGKKTTEKSSFSLSGINLYNASAKTYYYVLVPTGQAIYDTVFGLELDNTFTPQGTMTAGNQTHTIYKSVGTTRNITSIEIK